MHSAPPEFSVLEWNGGPLRDPFHILSWKFEGDERVAKMLQLLNREIKKSNAFSLSACRFSVSISKHDT